MLLQDEDFYKELNNILNQRKIALIENDYYNFNRITFGLNNAFDYLINSNDFLIIKENKKA